MGVVYTDLESAMKGEYADMVKKHFMKLVKPSDHKFAALHGPSGQVVPLSMCRREFPWKYRCNPISG